MLKKILTTLLKENYKNIVLTDDIKEIMHTDDAEYVKDKFNVNTIKDIRSATFYALGKENLHNKTAVIVRGEELQNTLTGITETWFQRLNVIIIALYEKYDNIKTGFIYRVIPNIIKIYEDDYSQYEKKILKSTNAYMPSLITLKYNFKNVEYNYDNLIGKLKNIMKEDDEVILYSDEDFEKVKEFKIKNIDQKYKYGILSKYMGYIIGKNKRVLLCIPTSLALIELNIFNNRYINEKFKIILFNSNKIDDVETLTKWVNNNKIKARIIDSLENDDLEEFWNSKEPEALIIKGEI